MDGVSEIISSPMCIDVYFVRQYDIIKLSE